MADEVKIVSDPVEAQLILIDGYPIDAALSESHDFPAEVTEYEREKGADATDHVRIKPLKITMDCIVSDSPLGAVAQHSTRTDGSIPSGTMYQRLLKLRESGEPIVVSTSLDIFEDMVLSDLGIPREGGEGHHIHFKVEFTQATIIENARTTVRTASPTGQGNKNLGPRLATLTEPYTLVVTVTKKDPDYDLPLRGFRQPVLISKNGDKHYAVDSAPPADGWVDRLPGPDLVYHSLTNASTDWSTGIVRNKEGNITEVGSPGTMGVEDRNKVLSNASGDIWKDVANGKSVSPIALGQVL